MTATTKVAIITGASQGIGAGLVAGFRGAGYAVVGNSRSIGSVEEPDYLTVEGDIAEVETARRVVDRALDRFGRIDSLINNAGIFIAKPFTDYSVDEYEAITAVNLAGFFHIKQPSRRWSLGAAATLSTSPRASSTAPAASDRPGWWP
jgi:NAD(P)-dependent dehydrogenase (short-subunit alcohol dehydrogenase family)